MKFLGMFFVCCLILFGSLILTGDAQDDAASQQRLRDLQRDERLIESLVEGGLQLSEEDDALKRAETCNQLAGHLARSLQVAVGSKDHGRVADLGKHLQALLVRGVAGNLTQARKDYPPDSPRLTQVREHVIAIIKPLEDDIERASTGHGQQMLSTLDAMQQGRAEVERALKGKSNGPGGLKKPPAGSKKSKQ